MVRTLYCLLTQGGVLKAVWPESMDMGILMAIFCAVIHDFEHKGVNNDFLIKSSDALAVSAHACGTSALSRNTYYPGTT